MGPRFTTTTGRRAWWRAARSGSRTSPSARSRAPAARRGGVEGVHGGVAALDARLGDVLAEEHHVGLEHAAAALAAGYDEAGGLVELDVAVGADRDVGVPLAPAGVELGEPLGAAPPGWSAPGSRGRPRRRSGRAARTRRAEPARLVQAVDVLGDQQPRPAGRLEARRARGARRWARARFIRDQPRCERGPVALLRRRGRRRTPGRSSASAPGRPGRGSRGCRSRCSGPAPVSATNGRRRAGRGRGHAGDGRRGGGQRAHRLPAYGPGGWPSPSHNSTTSAHRQGVSANRHRRPTGPLPCRPCATTGYRCRRARWSSA